MLVPGKASIFSVLLNFSGHQLEKHTRREEANG
jgi:hypothetical protein